MMYILGIILLVIVFYFFGTYNKFVTTKTRIKASIQEIGNQLKRQAELIPNLVDSVKGYLKHEKGIFEAITEARKAILNAANKNDPQLMVDADAKFRSTLGEFKVILENTPELKAVEAVTKLMDELRDTSDKIMYSRRILIDLSADYNVMVVTIPSNIVARLFNFKTEKGLSVPEEGQHLEVSDEEMKSPKVKLE